jgi:hypothetical protein
MEPLKPNGCCIFPAWFLLADAPMSDFGFYLLYLLGFYFVMFALSFFVRKKPPKDKQQDYQI